MPLSPSSEMYLKTILSLTADGRSARVQDIAARLGVRMPSVSQALRRLAERKYVSHSPYGTVRLTARGARAARDVSDRHRVIEEFLTRVLNVAPAVAAREACAMEHVVSPGTRRRLAEFLAAWERSRTASPAADPALPEDRPYA